MPDFTVVYRLDAITADNPEHAAQEAAGIMREVMNGQHPGANTFEVYDGDQYAPHGTTTVEIETPQGLDTLAKPYTFAQLHEHANDQGEITALVAFDLDHLLEGVDQLNLRASEAITGAAYALQDIAYTLTAVRKSRALLTVIGNVGEYLDENTCTTPGCTEEERGDGEGYAGRCPHCADLLYALEEGGEDVDYDNDSRTLAELEAARDAQEAARAERAAGYVWNEHTNDCGDHCPHSGDPIGSDVDPDDDAAACPARCRRSAPERAED